VGVEPTGDRITCHPPVLKITWGVLTGYENSLLYLIRQPLARIWSWSVLIGLARFWAWNYHVFITAVSEFSRHCGGNSITLLWYPLRKLPRHTCRKAMSEQTLKSP